MTDAGRRVLGYCRSAQQQGVRVVADLERSLYVESDRTLTLRDEQDPRCQALETVLLGRPMPSDENPGQFTSRILGVTREWCVGFLLGCSAESDSEVTQWLDDIKAGDEQVGFQDGIDVWKALHCGC